MIYQGLDFDRDPLPVQRVAADLRLLPRTYAADPVFHVFGRPLHHLVRHLEVLPPGHRAVARAACATVLRARLGEERRRLRARGRRRRRRRLLLVVGRPARRTRATPRAATQMGEVVHTHRWPLDRAVRPRLRRPARRRHRAVDRRDGATLRAEYGAAVAPRPDALGLISWNEFSENTHVEPSERYGDRYIAASSPALRRRTGRRCRPGPRTPANLGADAGAA